MTTSAKLAFVVLSFILISVMRVRGLQAYAAVPVFVRAKMFGLPAPYLNLIRTLSKPTAR